MAQWSGGDLAAAVETWRLTLEAATRTRQPMVVFPAVTALANGLNQTGRRAEAEALCRTILEEYADPAGSSRPIAWWVRLPLGLLRYEANDLVEARRELERGFAAAGTFGGGLLVAWAVGYLALVRQATGSPEAALEVVRAVSRATRECRYGPPRPDAGDRGTHPPVAGGCRRCGAVGRPGSARRARPVRRCSTLLRLSQDLTIARVRLAQARPADARALLDRARAAAEATGAVADLISIRVLEAAVAEATGRRPEARHVLAGGDPARGARRVRPAVRRRRARDRPSRAAVAKDRARLRRRGDRRPLRVAIGCRRVPPSRAIALARRGG